MLIIGYVIKRDNSLLKLAHEHELSLHIISTNKTSVKRDSHLTSQKQNVNFAIRRFRWLNLHFFFDFRGGEIYICFDLSFYTTRK